MTEQDNPHTARRDRLRRELEINAMWGLGNAGCHDVHVSPSPTSFEPVEGEDFYTVSLDLATGELTYTPGEFENEPEVSNAAKEQETILDAAAYWGTDYGSLPRNEP